MKKFLVACLILSLVSSIFAESVFAEKRTIIATAYYSPIPGQSYYLKGSYEADIRLNGKGTHGASGSPVYVGMIAAPKTYAFGTKIVIAGMGTGTVEDRGGAIVTAGKRNNQYDRIDIWMGSGEEWLARALAWGRRTINVDIVESQTGAVLANKEKKTNTFQVASLPLAKLPAIKSASGSTVQSGALATSKNSGSGVVILKSKAFSWVLMASEIITSSGTIKSASGALLSHVGDTKTGTGAKNGTESLIVKKETIKVSLIEWAITDSSSKEKIGAVSRALIRLGFMEWSPKNAYTPDMKMAVSQFQLEYKLVIDVHDKNIGIFGEKTAKKLASVISSLQKASK